jgi:hypothetical protein
MDEQSNPRALSPRKRHLCGRSFKDKNEGWWRRHVWLATTSAGFHRGSCRQPIFGGMVIAFLPMVESKAFSSLSL